MNFPRIMAKAPTCSPFRLTIVYVIFAMLWVAASDGLITRWTDGSLAVLKANVLEGLLFVVVTAVGLYFLARRLVRDHHRITEALRDSQLRWQFALEGAGDGLWDWEVGTDRTYFSKQWKAMLGYAEDEIGNTLAEWETRVHPEDLAQTQVELARHFKGETQIYTNEHRLRAKDGTYMWILDRGQIVSWAADGSPLRMIGTHTDITTRKSGEARMADALAFVRAILHSSPVGIIAYGPDGQASIANGTAAHMVGTDVAGLLRQNFRELESWRRHGLLDAADRALASGREVVHAGPLTTSFGRSLQVETRFMPFDHAGDRHLLLIMSDETGIRRTLDNLRLMQAAVQAAPIGWAVTDPAGTIEWVNPGFTALTGYTAEEVIGRNPRLLNSGRHPPEFYAAMWSTIKRGEVWSGEMFNQHKAGHQYHEFMTIAPVRGDDGTIAHFVAIKQDITEQKGLEQQLARAQRLESIGMLASGIAHDLNNIFTPILLSLELLKLKYPTADGRKTLDLIESAGQRGAGIVRQVLTFARGIEGERTEIHPKYLVKELSQILSETFPRGITIETDLASVLHSTEGDATQLHQVLLNLAINARDAMPGGGRLILGAHNVIVDAARAAPNPLLKPGPCVAFTVTDTGSGIPPEVLEHMFEPFYTTKPRDKGTGLGLSTVYGIVRSHGGVVEVSTKLGCGTKFTVLLPATGQAVARGASRFPISIPLAGAGRMVLVVDDEEPIRRITALALAGHGFVVETAADGLEAKEIFSGNPNRFHVLITDMMMPRMGGLDLVREVRRLAPTMPVIVSSGLCEEGDKGGMEPAGLSALGVRTLLRKPYTEVELLAALRQELEQGPAARLTKE